MDPREDGGKFSTTVMNIYVALEIAIGHKLGLLSALKESNNQELADSCKLKEREVSLLPVDNG